MTITRHLKVGFCANDKSDLVQGATFQEDKFHNCNDCGYMNRYSDELVEYDKKTKLVTWSSVN